MGCSSSKLSIPVSGFQNKRSESSDKGAGNSKSDDMSNLNVPKIVGKDSSDSSVPIGSSTGNPRNKVALMPGRSMIDWMKYHRHAPDPSGTGGKMLRVTREELAKHNKKDDAWMALNGKVYNVTPYLEYHPGGVSELMRGAGIDGTGLFNEVHRWVNYESMLKRCCVGIFDTSTTTFDRLHITSSPSNGAHAEAPQNAAQNSDKVKKPRYSWSQKDDIVTITITTFYDNIQRHHVTVDITGQDLLIHVIVRDHIFLVDINLEAEVLDKFDVVKSPVESGEVDVILKKKKRGTFWKVVGNSKEEDNAWKVFSVGDLTYRRCRLISKVKLTHDVFFFRFQLPTRSFFVVPVGCHAFLRADVDEGFQITKPYTAVPRSLKLSNKSTTTTTSDDDDNDDGDGCTVNFIIKIYPNGVLTPSLGRLKEGDSLDISAVYTGTSFEDKLPLLESSSRVVLMAAGTGITPMLSVVNHLSKRDNKGRSVQLLFFNKTEEDVIWREELEKYCCKNPWFSFSSILSQPSSIWKGLKGRVDLEIMKKVVKVERDVCFFCICGPSPFTRTTIDLLHGLSVADSHIHAFIE